MFRERQTRIKTKAHQKISGIGVTEALALWERKAGVRLSDSRPMATRRMWVGAADCKSVVERLGEFKSLCRHSRNSGGTVYTSVLGTDAERRAGSNPVCCTLGRVMKRDHKV